MLRQTVPRSDPQQLGLVRIKLETISGQTHGGQLVVHGVRFASTLFSQGDLPL